VLIPIFCHSSVRLQANLTAAARTVVAMIEQTICCWHPSVPPESLDFAQVHSIKHIIGRKFSEEAVAHTISHQSWAFGVLQSPSGDCHIHGK
jgi:hypothetical protein